MSKKNNIVTMAEEINDHLKNDGVVIVSTYYSQHLFKIVAV